MRKRRRTRHCADRAVGRPKNFQAQDAFYVGCGARHSVSSKVDAVRLHPCAGAANSFRRSGVHLAVSWRRFGRENRSGGHRCGSGGGRGIAQTELWAGPNSVGAHDAPPAPMCGCGTRRFGQRRCVKIDLEVIGAGAATDAALRRPSCGPAQILSGAGRVACTYVRVRQAAFWSEALRENRSGGHRCGSGGGRGIAQTELWAGPNSGRRQERHASPAPMCGCGTRRFGQRRCVKVDLGVIGAGAAADAALRRPSCGPAQILQAQDASPAPMCGCGTRRFGQRRCVKIDLGVIGAERRRTRHCADRAVGRPKFRRWHDASPAPMCGCGTRRFGQRRCVKIDLEVIGAEAAADAALRRPSCGPAQILSGAGRVACRPSSHVRVRHAAFWSAALRESRSGGHRCGSGGGRGIAQTELWAGPNVACTSFKRQDASPCTYVRVRQAAFWSAALRENRSGGHRCGSGDGRGIAQTELWAGPNSVGGMTRRLHLCAGAARGVLVSGVA